MADKYSYAGVSSLSRFLNNLYGIFAEKEHTHTHADITDHEDCEAIPNDKIDEICPDARVYGVTWTVGANSALTRTDAAAAFEAPVPSVGGSAGSSPFDSLMPWSGMQIVEDDTAGTLVSIPKFWYRVAHTGTEITLQIADAAMSGFAVSPAHADRGDGKGERDVVYIGRYKCAGSQGQSISGEAPIVNITRPAFRSAFAELAGDGYSMQDYAMFWTTRMLMLVEYANWDLQSAIGYNCGNGSSAENTGASDAMPYHTGTIQASLDTYGVGVQYRYIEDPWGNVAEWVDGWRAEATEDESAMNIYVITNPAEFSDDTGGVLVGSIPMDVATAGGMISNWAVPTVEGYSWAMFPSAIELDNLTTGFGEYCADVCGFYCPALYVGGGYDPYPGCGAFCMAAGPAESSVDSIGARLQKIP